MRSRSLVPLASALLLFTFAPSVFAAESVAAGITEQQMAIQYVLDNRIMPLEQDGVFHPSDYTSRVQFAVNVVETLYSQEDFKNCFRNIAPKLPPRFTLLFSDVPTSAWYAEDLCVGMFTGILNGNRDGSFHPLKGITAAEASKILSKAYGLTYPALQMNGRPWYEASMRTMIERGALKKGISPSKILTRGEVAQMFYALRNQPRFPEHREIGKSDSNKTSGTKADVLKETATATMIEATGTDGSITVRVQAKVLEPGTPRPVLTKSDAATVAMERRGPRVSRRTLREQVRLERAQQERLTK